MRPGLSSNRPDLLAALCLPDPIDAAAVVLRPLKSKPAVDDFVPPGLTPLALAACLLLTPHGAAWAQQRQSQPQVGTQVRQIAAKPAPKPRPASRAEADKNLPVQLDADSVSSRLDQETRAEGNALLQRGDLTLKADSLSYNQSDDLATAQGSVIIERDGNVFTGPELRLHVQRFEGEFISPTYFFSATGAGGKAARVDFIDENRLRAVGGTYSSCRPDDPDKPLAWELSTRSIRLDFEANEGVADGAVVRFYGVPILAAPRLSFPLGDQRKSGWLPPTFNQDSRSGVEFGVPYYWNIAPQRDATVTPKLITRRGFGVDSEFRYLTPRHDGQITLDVLPNDRIADATRWATSLKQNGSFADWRYHVNAERVSDNIYWKDFPHGITSLTPRLLATDLGSSRSFNPGLGEVQLYGRWQQWQVLQDIDDRISTPYQRSPQLGTRWTATLPRQFEAGLNLEYNRFDLPRDYFPRDLPTGSRVHALGHLGWSREEAGWWFKPRLSFNAASYDLDRPLADGRRSASRVVPTFSIDQGWVFERKTEYFGRALVQTLEPRLFYVRTPYRDQVTLPNFDAAAKDFNFDSIYTENDFSGVDRVSDAHQLTMGVVSRMTSQRDGSELLRLGVVQRFQFRDQRITAEGTPNTQKLSDLLLLGSAHLNPRWWADGAVQYNSESNRAVRSVLSLRYSPGPFRTVNATYRLARGQSEQAELGWQWPISGAGVPEAAVRRGTSGGSSCSGTWYSVGRVLYSLQDRRVTDALVGFEYDAGCWIGRMGVERRSTGRTEANTRWMFQLELVGLGRLGNIPLNVLRDNIPGYRLLRDDRAALTDASYD
jgi:LPS-assembly protein